MKTWLRVFDAESRLQFRSSRHSFVFAALEAVADLTMVQALAGHASPTTTARHDRHPETAKAAAARLIHIPYNAG